MPLSKVGQLRGVDYRDSLCTSERRSVVRSYARTRNTRRIHATFDAKPECKAQPLQHKGRLEAAETPEEGDKLSLLLATSGYVPQEKTSVFVPLRLFMLW